MEKRIAEFDELRKVIDQALRRAEQLGADGMELGAMQDNGFSVIVRNQAVEAVEYQADRDLNLTVYFGQRKGSASTTDIRPEGINAAVEAACRIAQYTSEDPYAGLADAALMPKGSHDLNLYHPWALTPVEAIDLALSCEAKALAIDKRVTQSDGITLGTFQTHYLYANSHGFVGEIRGTSHEAFCSLIAEADGHMERDGDYTVSRFHEKLTAFDELAALAVKRVTSRLGGRQIPTMKTPVIFSAQVARSLFSHFLSAISGGSLYRKTSFLLDQLGQPIFSDVVNLREYPHILGGLSSALFDSDGVATYEKDFIRNGVLRNYLLGDYSARRLGLMSTGNANGAHNLFLESQAISFEQLLKKMGTGVLVTELMGQGVSIVTGDYSRGIAGFWVENGEIQYPITGVTLAGNLKNMFKNIVAISNDVDTRGNIQTGSILLEEMTIGGSTS